MAYLPPNFKIIDCVKVDVPLYPSEKVIAYILDADGNKIAEYEYSEINGTGWYCAEITTPEEEGVYAIDYKIFDEEEYYIYEMEDKPLVVTTTASPLALAMKIHDYVIGEITDDVIEIGWYTYYITMALVYELYPALKNAESEVDATKSKITGELHPKLSEILNIVNEIIDLVDNQVMPSIQSMKQIVEELIRWAKTRII